MQGARGGRGPPSRGRGGRGRGRGGRGGRGGSSPLQYQTEPAHLDVSKLNPTGTRRSIDGRPPNLPRIFPTKTQTHTQPPQYSSPTGPGYTSPPGDLFVEEGNAASVPPGILNQGYVPPLPQHAPPIPSKPVPVVPMNNSNGVPRKKKNH